MTEILAGSCEPGEGGRRPPECLYGSSVKMWEHLNRQGIMVARCTVERLMRASGWRGVTRGRQVRTTIADPAHSRAPVGDALDNALAETTIGPYKTGCTRPGSPFRTGPIRSLADLEEITSAWAHWYSTARLGRGPPAEAQAGYYQRQRTPRERGGPASRAGEKGKEAASPPLIVRARRAGYGAAPPASGVLRVALRATALRAALDPGDLGRPWQLEERAGQGLPGRARGHPAVAGGCGYLGASE